MEGGEAGLLGDVFEDDGSIVNEPARGNWAMKRVADWRMSAPGGHAVGTNGRGILLAESKRSTKQSADGDAQHGFHLEEVPDVGSSICRIWSARMPLSFCWTPLGQWISIDCAMVSGPRPKWTRLSPEER